MSANEQLELIAAASEKQTEREYWLNEVFANPAELFFSRKKQRLPAIAHTPDLSHSHFSFSAQAAARAIDICGGSDTSLQVLLMTVMGCWLSKQQDNPDVMIGTTVYKPAAGYANTPINTLLAIRNNFDPEQSFRQLLKAMGGKMQQGIAHQNYPIRLLLNQPASQETAGQPVFGTAFILENVQEAIHTDELLSELLFCCKRSGQEISCSVFYDRDVYDTETIVRYFARFSAMLEKLIAAPDLPVKNTGYLPDDEQQLCMEAFNDTAFNYDDQLQCLQEIIEKQVSLTPERTALRWDQGSLSFAELNTKANRLAWHLRSKGVGPDSVVAIIADRSPEMIIGIYGIVKAGAAYLPIEYASPAERIQYRVANSGCRVVLYTNGLPAFAGNQDIDTIDLSSEAAYDADDSNPPVINQSSDLAYVIYTSGSTGLPKGVMIGHRALLNRIRWMQRQYPLTSDDVILQKTNFTFDVSVWELFWGVFSGAQLCLLKAGAEKDPEQLIDTIAASGTTVIHFVPSMLYAFLELAELQHLSDRMASLRYVMASGEALSYTAVNRFNKLAPAALLANLYGPTEAAIDVSFFDCPKSVLTGPVPIGKPIDNIQLYITNSRRNLAGIGVTGELCIGGTGLARGYINNPGLTGEKFTTVNWHEGPLYCTGDLASWLPDGTILYHGRTDSQIKLRGYRIELGEIESVLNSYPAIQNAVVSLTGNDQGDKQLLAYFIATEEVNAGDLRSWLQSKLPDYMIPACFLQLDEFPLTVSGKVNKKMLPLPEGEQLSREAYAAPVTEAEQKIAAIWTQELKLLRGGLHDNFFEWGGDSIKAIRLINKLRKAFGRGIRIMDLYKFPTIKGLADHLEQASLLSDAQGNDAEQEVQAELAALKQQVLPLFGQAEGIADIFPMSDIQSGMVFASLVNPELAVYHDQFLFRIPGLLEPELFKAALQRMADKHEILRTAFDLEKHPGGLQVVYGNIALPFSHVSLAGQQEEEAQHTIREFLRSERARPFDFATPALWRADLFLLNDSTVFVFQFHHAILDGWSVASFNSELYTVYNELKTGSATAAGRLHCSYRDYIVESLVEKKTDDPARFWQQELDGFKRLEIFGADAQNTRLMKAYDPAFHSELQSRAAAAHVNIKTVFFGAFVYALNMLSYEDECTIGLVTNNRPVIEDGDKVLGCFLNTIPVRTKMPGAQLSWSGFIQEVEAKLYSLKSKERTTLLDIARSTGHKATDDNPYFDVSFNFTNFHIYETLGEDFLRPRQADKNTLNDLSYEITNTFLNFTVNLTRGTLSLNYRLRKQLRSGKTLDDLHDYLDRFLQLYLADPQGVCSPEKLLPAEEKEELLQTLGLSVTASPLSGPVIGLFEQQVGRTPHHPALVFENQRLSYEQLNRQGDAVCRLLKEKGVAANEPVVVSVKRSAATIACILGILKAGAVFVPVAADYPPDRLKYILDDTGCRVCLCDPGLFATLSSAGVSATCILADENLLDVEGPVYPSPTTAGNVYIIYTSGSTGKPKGVLVPDSALADHIAGLQQYVGAEKMGSAALFASLTADAGYSVLFSLLTSGGTVHVLSDERLMDGQQVVAYLETEKIDFIKLVPSLWLAYAENGYVPLPRKAMLFGGEAFSPRIIDILKQVSFAGAVFNHYGPTEATIGKCIHTVDLERSYNGTVPIGRPFSTTRLYIVNRKGALLPRGVAGELLIGGKGLAAGYWNAADLTAKAFIADQFGSPGDRCYKTGDLCRWNSDGDIEFFGRLDEQVKINGHRIEPGDIEFAIRACPDVLQGAVLVKRDGKRLSRIIAYVVPASSFSQEGLVNYLRGKLPEYMLPSAIVLLDTMPVTHIGKVDKRKLAEYDAAAPATTGYVAPRSVLEKTLAALWQELLGIERVGIHDNFFESGGDSITTIQLTSRAKKMGIGLQPRDVFTYQQIARIAAAIENRDQIKIIAEQGVLTGECALLPAQQRFFEISGSQPDSVLSHFNHSVLLAISKDIPAARLEEIVAWLTLQHDSLRFSYQHKDGTWTQSYTGQPAMLETVDFSATDDEELAGMIESMGKQVQQQSIREGRLTRFILIHTPEATERHRLLVVLHHLLVDVVSWRILLDDLAYCLEAGHDQPLPASRLKTSSVRDWHLALQGYAGTEKLLQQAPYWQSIVKEETSLPEDINSEEAVLMQDISYASAKLSPELTETLLQKAPATFNTEINDLLITALSLTMSDWNEGQETLISLEGHGREASIHEGMDLDNTTGWFTSVYPLLLQPVPAAQETGHTIRTIKEQLRNIPDKGIGYGVLRYIAKEPALQSHAAPQVVFNYLGQLGSVKKENPHFSIATESIGKSITGEMPAHFRMMIVGRVEDGCLRINWSYSRKHYYPATIEALSQNFISRLEAVIACCLDAGNEARRSTPSDFGLSGLITLGEFDRFLSDPLDSGHTIGDKLESVCRLSPLQEGMLFHSLFDNQEGAYMQQLSCDFDGLDIDVFQQCWNHLLNNHSILRSGFFYDRFSVPVQCVFRDIEVPVDIIDMRHLDPAQQEEAIRKTEDQERATAFIFSQAPLLRLKLVRTSDTRYKMIKTSHHILYDGWSMAVMMEEFLRNYELIAEGKPALAGRNDNFADYIHYLDSIDKKQEQRFWTGYLSGIEEGTPLSIPVAAAVQQADERGIVETGKKLDEAITSRAVAYARKHSITLNTLFQGAWAFLLHAYGGSDTIVFGVTVAGRPDDLAQMEQRVGLYINTIPLVSSIGNHTGIDEWLQDIQQGQIEARNYQYAALKDIRQWAGITGTVFDTTLTFQNYPVATVINENQWKLKVSGFKTREQNNFPLSLTIDAGSIISLWFRYNTALISQPVMEMMMEQYAQVVQQIVSGTSVFIKDLSLIPDTEKDHLLHVFGRSSSSTRAEGTIAGKVYERARLTPEVCAIKENGISYSYAWIDELSTRLARHLRQLGVKEEVMVPVCMPQGAYLLVSLLAIWKAGGAYVPLDPEFPQERIAFVLKDTQARIAIGSSSCMHRLQECGTEHIVVPEQILAPGADSSDPTPLPLPGPGHLAYVIYTSGSTGQPKGVMIEHKSLLAYIDNQHTRYTGSAAGNTGSFLHLSSTFDASVTALFMPYIFGRSLQAGPATGAQAFEDPSFIAGAPYDFIKLTPSHLPLLENILTKNKLSAIAEKIVAGGEALHWNQVKFLQELETDTVIINEYGPTEATVGCCVYEFSVKQMTAHPGGAIPIGRPIENVQLYVLDRHLNPVPAGLPGELYISGPQVARGYLNQPELTQQKFITDILRPDAKMYRTGDWCRWRKDGNLEFLGRIDDQVKISGYRVETGEVENAILQCAGIRQVFVSTFTDGSGAARLIAYIVTETGFSQEAMEEQLVLNLPAYMLPSRWVLLDEMPLTINGKVNKRLLPAPNEFITAAIELRDEPANELQEQLAAIWKRLLEVDTVSVHDDFFDLGGHSLLAIRLVSALRRELNIGIAIGDVFDYPTIQMLSDHLRPAPGADMASSIPVGQRPERIPLSYSQERLWFIDKLQGSTHYHLPSVITLKGNLDQPAFEFAFQSIVTRHESLRTVFKEENGEAYQEIQDASGWLLERIDGTGYDKETLDRLVAECIAAPFDLSKDYMLRAILVKLANHEHLLVMVVHHIASDGWSMPILVRELTELYASHTANRKSQLPALPVQYADYAIWQRRQLSGELLEQRLAFWQQRLEGVSPLLLPLDQNRGHVQTMSGRVIRHAISPLLRRKIEEQCQLFKITPFMFLLAAFKVLLHRYSGQEDICVGTPVAGRQQQELEGMIGFFVNTLALRSRIDPAMSFPDLIVRLRETILEAYQYQDVPFEKVVERVVRARELNRSPMFQVMFVMQNNERVKNELFKDLHGLELSAGAHEQVNAKFDLTFHAEEYGEEYMLSAEYSVDLFRQATIQRMLSHFTGLLESILTSDGTPVGRLAMMDSRELEQIKIFSSSAAEVGYPTDQTITGLIAAQAAAIPDHTALIFGTETMTYGRLDRLSNQLAHLLATYGAGREDKIGICMNKGFGMIISILGVLKSGAAYVPIDPHYPAGRISYMAADSGIGIALVDKTGEAALKEHADTGLILIDPSEDLVVQYADTPLERECHSDDLAYIIYTSGSTGQPKGVMIEHGNLTRLFVNDRSLFDFGRDDVWTLFHSFCFDFSVWEIFGALIFGGRLVIVPEEASRDTALFERLLVHHRVTVLNQTPSAFYVLQEQVMQQTSELAIRYVIFGGEALNPSRLRPWRQHLENCRLINMYGITEITVHATFKELQTEDLGNAASVIGKPIPALSLFITDGFNNFSPVGVPGELMVGGKGVARGYLNRPELTGEKFSAASINGLDYGRLYRTGDIGRWLPDGSIEYFGRKDEQVKIRGYRIEPGEIESALCTIEGIRQAMVVAVKREKEEEKVLVGYVVPEGEFHRDKVMASLRTVLPEYMVPQLWVEMGALPLTSNGKTDKRALPSIDLSLAGRTEYVAPRTAIEEQLAAIWSSLLGVDRIGINDNFFSLGGHSLLGVRMMSAINQRFDITVSLRALFEFRCIAELSEYIELLKSSQPQVQPAEFDVHDI